MTIKLKKMSLALAITVLGACALSVFFFALLMYVRDRHWSFHLYYFMVVPVIVAQHVLRLERGKSV